MEIILEVISITAAPAGLKYVSTGKQVAALALVLASSENTPSVVEKMIVPLGSHLIGLGLVGMRLDCLEKDEVSFD